MPTLSKAPDPKKLMPRMQHTPDTQKILKKNGLPQDVLLGVTTGGRVRHIAVPHGTRLVDSLCRLFRRGTSIMRPATTDDKQPLCRMCLRTLDAEVLRAKEALKNEPKEG